MLRPALPLALFALLLSSRFAPAQNSPVPMAMHVEGAPSAPPLKIYRDHSIRDIEAIGNRNVGCSRGFGNWYALERQVAMGKQYSEQVESSSKLIKDPAITEYVNRIGQDLVRNSDSLVAFTIKVIDS